MFDYDIRRVTCEYLPSRELLAVVSSVKEQCTGQSALKV